jgi:cytochrome c-type biogenesis protein CcmH/NrfG
LEALAKIEPENINYWIEIGRLRRGLLQYEAAQEAFSKARTVAPKRAEGHAAMADLLVSANKEPAEALAAARKAAELSPTATHFALVAAAAEKNGDLPGALIAMARAMELSPENPRFAQIYEDFKKAAAAKAPPGKP